MPGNDSIAATAVAAQRNGYTAMNWAIGDPRFKTGAATATAVTPSDIIIRGMIGSGPTFTKGKIVLGSDPGHIITSSVGRLTTQVGQDLQSAIVPMAMPVSAQDTLNLYVDNANQNEINHVVVFLDRPDVKGASKGSYKRIWPLRGASTTASVAHTWGSKTITFDNALSNPKGKYHILGMSIIGAVSIAARVYNPDNPNLRPTILGNPTATTGAMQEFDNGSIVEFQGDQLGNLVFEELNETTTAAFEFLLLIGEL